MVNVSIIVKSTDSLFDFVIIESCKGAVTISNHSLFSVSCFACGNASIVSPPDATLLTFYAEVTSRFPDAVGGAAICGTHDKYAIVTKSEGVGAFQLQCLRNEIQLVGIRINARCKIDDSLSQGSFVGEHEAVGIG